MKKIVIITGQTATGKTRLAVELAKKHKGELINADSRQIYKYLDIVTGQDKSDLEDVPIHLYDILDPRENFSSSDWTKLAIKTIDELRSRGKTPIIVGGTYLYLKHLLYGVETEGVGPDWKLREKLKNKTVEELQKLIAPAVLNSMNQSDRNNPRRLIRKIELLNSEKLAVSTAGIPTARRSGTEGASSTGGKKGEAVANFELQFIGLRYKNRTDLREALRKRVDERIKLGAVREVKKLIEKGYKLNDPGLSSNACMEIYQYLTGHISLEELADRWITTEMQYAKRQYAFMKQDKHIEWKEL